MKLAIRVKPGASRNIVQGCYSAPSGNALIVSVTTHPHKGQSNVAVIELLAKTLGCAKSEITILSGLTARNKIVNIPDVCYPKAVALMQLN